MTAKRLQPLLKRKVIKGMRGGTVSFGRVATMRLWAIETVIVAPFCNMPPDEGRIWGVTRFPYV